MSEYENTQQSEEAWAEHLRQEKAIPLRIEALRAAAVVLAPKWAEITRAKLQNDPAARLMSAQDMMRTLIDASKGLEAWLETGS